MAEVETKLQLRVQPGASRNEIVGLEEGILKVRITASPVKGKANQALLEFLSKTLGVSRSRLAISRGTTGRRKTVTVEGLSPSQVMERLEQP